MQSKKIFKVLFFFISLLNYKTCLSSDNEVFEVKATSSSHASIELFPVKTFSNEQESEYFEKNQNLASNLNITLNPNVVSICSGYGVTDRMFLQGGFRILSSIDKDSNRTHVNTLNNVNVISNTLLRHTVLTGDITDQTTIKECVSSIQSILKINKKGNQDLNLVYAFIPWGKNVNTNEIINSIFELILALKNEKIVPQIICFEMNNTAQKNYNGISHNIRYKRLLETYVEKEEQIDVSHYGVAATNQRHYRLWIKNTPKIFNFPSQQNKSTIKTHLNNFRTHYPNLIPENWWNQSIPCIENFPLHTFNCELKTEEQKILEEWEGGKAIKELPCENGNNCLICLTCQFKQAVNKERGGRNNSFQRTLIDGYYPTSITSSSYKWWLNPHPTQNRAYTLAELMALFGYSDLQNFKFTDKETIQANSFIEFIAQPTSPHFLRQLFISFNNAFDLVADPLQINLNNMPTLFYSGNISYGGSSKIKFIYKPKDNPSTFFDQFKQKNSISKSNSRFLNTLLSIYPTDFQALKKAKQEKFMELMTYIKMYANIFEFVGKFRTNSEHQPMLSETLETKIQPLTDCLVNYYPYISSIRNQPYHCDLRKTFKNSKVQETLKYYSDIINDVKIELLTEPNKIETVKFEKKSSQVLNTNPHTYTVNNQKRKRSSIEEVRKFEVLNNTPPSEPTIQNQTQEIYTTHDQNAHKVDQHTSTEVTQHLSTRQFFKNLRKMS